MEIKERAMTDLRESVARVEERARGLELSADEIERGWPRTSENATLVAWKRRDAADLRAILSALSNARAAIAAALKEMGAEAKDAMLANAALREALKEVLSWHDYTDDMHKPVEVRAAYMRARATLAQPADGGK